MTPITSSLLASRLVRLQVGQETAWGSSATATSIPMLITPVPTIQPAIKVTQFDEQRGSLAPTFVQAQLATGGLFALTGIASYEDILYTLGMTMGAPTLTGNTTQTITGISVASPTEITTSGSHGWLTGQTVVISGSNSTPVVDGVYAMTKTAANKFTIPVNVTVIGSAGNVGVPAVWSYAAPLSAAWVPLSLTAELGNVASSADAVKLTGCLAQTWKLEGSFSNPVTFTANGFGKTFSGGQTMTGSLQYRTVEPILFPDIALSMEAAGGTPGTTPFSATLVSFALEGVTGLNPAFTAGSKAPSAFTYAKQEVALTLGVFFSSTTKAYIQSNFVGGLPIVAQLKSTSGAKALGLDYAGALTDDPIFWGDSQGGMLVELKLGAQYDATMANYLKAVVTNSIATLP